MSELLQQVTGKGEAAWIARVQELIQSYTAVEDDGLPHTKTGLVLSELAHEVALLCGDEEAKEYDGNLRSLSVLALICTAWYVRCKRSKVCDPRRDTAAREHAYDELIWFQSNLMRPLVDFASDVQVFEQPERRIDDLFRG